MRMYVGITDFNWFNTLKQANCDEVNFWKPGGRTNFKALDEGDLFLFKLHSPDDYIVGGGIFLKFSILPSSLAWEAFGIANGAKSLVELNNRVYKYKKTNRLSGGEAEFIGYTGDDANISIPDTLGGYPVTSVGDWASSTYTGLISIRIPAGIRSIGNQDLSALTSLTSIVVDASNLYYASVDGMLFNKAKTNLVACPPGLTSINIPQGVTSIGYGAFFSCTGLTSINIPQGVTSIGESAFQACSGLTSISIPQGVTSIGDWAFGECSSLNSITIPDSVPSIGEGPFYGCSSLATITFNSATTTIYDDAETIPVATTIIGYDPSVAKDYATKYSRTFEVIGSTQPIETDYTYTVTDGKAQITKYKGAGGAVVIPNTLGGFPVTSIGRGAFQYCTSLTSITFKSATTEIYDESDTIPDETKIIGLDPSTAKDYAVKYGRTFETLTQPTDECFIATAAFGSKFTWPVALLRQFRDKYLLTNAWGTAFVKFYYRNSPPIAAVIANSQPLKLLVRVLLAPFIAVVYLIYNPGLALALMLICLVGVIVRRRMALQV